VTEMLGVKAVPHPQLYKVSWINSMAMEVKQWCLVPVDFNTRTRSSVMWLIWTVELICVNLYTRVRRLSYYHWNSSLDSSSVHLLYSRKVPLLFLLRLCYR